ncbi:hypothetical protein [Fibrella forsythiae]|uniref:TonB C-terminal domain-containing protein n=1 Tax=Fibrella forsythiae TaxID=2817061 RepID=A0ABS3JM03_9BACT|nr:hypothetical protein [Fibrella forsythiae]MBO0951030.1 hypothetical protein [Fibrella forsythiae]
MAREFFEAIAKQIRYPAASSKANKVAKAYVFFSVDDLGKIANVSVLNAANVDALFTEEINRVLTALPPLSQSYAGNYVLPVQFQLEGEHKLIAPLEENSAFVKFVKDKSLLGEVVVVGFTKS